MSDENKRCRGWIFTINNPTDWDRTDVERAMVGSTYGIVGDEVGENGTPHLQGFIRFKNAHSFHSIKQMLPRAHLEIQRGTCQQAADYCKKDGKFQEFGCLPQEKRSQGDKWKFIIEKAENGDIDAIKNEYPSEYFRYHERIKSFRIREPSILDELTNEWWWGETGTGKSKRAWELYPQHYNKLLNKWWDGYQNEEVVVIEEWAPRNDMTASNLKIWADRYPFNGEVKGGTLRNIRPKKIIVTSNYSMDQCFERNEDLEPLRRRFKTIHFPKETPWTLDDIFRDY
uniref:ATP-dependent helicase Rep n=1 Tax=uncultured virus TaxID=340016 RepID=A0A1D8MJV3_9VIRU|nr:putative rep protein [uncultured virus]